MSQYLRMRNYSLHFAHPWGGVGQQRCCTCTQIIHHQNIIQRCNKNNGPGGQIIGEETTTVISENMPVHTMSNKKRARQVKENNRIKNLGSGGRGLGLLVGVHADVIASPVLDQHVIIIIHFYWWWRCTLYLYFNWVLRFCMVISLHLIIVLPLDAVVLLMKLCFVFF